MAGRSQASEKVLVKDHTKVEMEGFVEQDQALQQEQEKKAGV